MAVATERAAAEMRNAELEKAAAPLLQEAAEVDEAVADALAAMPEQPSPPEPSPPEPSDSEEECATPYMQDALRRQLAAALQGFSARLPMRVQLVLASRDPQKREALAAVAAAADALPATARAAPALRALFKLLDDDRQLFGVPAPRARPDHPALDLGALRTGAPCVTQRSVTLPLLLDDARAALPLHEAEEWLGVPPFDVEWRRDARRVKLLVRIFSANTLAKLRDFDAWAQRRALELARLLIGSESTPAAVEESYRKPLMSTSDMYPPTLEVAIVPSRVPEDFPALFSAMQQRHTRTRLKLRVLVQPESLYSFVGRDGSRRWGATFVAAALEVRM